MNNSPTAQEEKDAPPNYEDIAADKTDAIAEAPIEGDNDTSDLETGPSNTDERSRDPIAYFASFEGDYGTPDLYLTLYRLFSQSEAANRTLGQVKRSLELSTDLFTQMMLWRQHQQHGEFHQLLINLIGKLYVMSGYGSGKLRNQLLAMREVSGTFSIRVSEKISANEAVLTRVSSIFNNKIIMHKATQDALYELDDDDYYGKESLSKLTQKYALESQGMSESEVDAAKETLASLKPRRFVF